MRCRHVREQMEAYLTEGGYTLSMTDREEVDAHLEGCRECRNEMSKRQRLRELLAETPAPPVPDGFAGRVLARAKALHREPATRLAARAGSHGRAWRRLRLATGTAAAVAVGLALGTYLGNDVWHQGDWQRQAVEIQRADAFTEAGLGRLVVDYDDSLAQTYLELTIGRDG